MIIFVTTRNHAYTVQSLVDGSFGPTLPRVQTAAWEDIFHARRLPRATYVFTDLERLSASELFYAAEVYQAASAGGLHCLNDPAKVRQRYALLQALYSVGYNPFAVYRAEASPRPKRFPVFIRNEADHGRIKVSELIKDQAVLDEALRALECSAIPLRFMIVIEFCAAPIAPGVWRKFGTFRLGSAMHVDHAVIEDTWLVKSGTIGLSTPEMFADELNVVTNNAGAEALRTAFDVGRIEYGRADHASMHGREVVYEINTNPHIFPLEKQRSPVRDEMLAIGRQRFARFLAAIDTPRDGSVSVAPVLPRVWQHTLTPLARRVGLFPKAISRF